MTRFGWVITTHVAAPAATLSAFFHPLPKLIWNASASVPIGIYAVHPAGALRTDELLVVTPPEKLATFLDARRYLPKGIPLLNILQRSPGRPFAAWATRSASTGSPSVQRSIGITWDARCPFGRAAG